MPKNHEGSVPYILPTFDTLDAKDFVWDSLVIKANEDKVKKFAAEHMGCEAEDLTITYYTPNKTT